jgi:hypothetical protein
MAAQEFDDIAALVNQWRADTLPVRTPSAALPIDIWAEAHAHTALAMAEAAMTREFTEWLETLP